MLGKASRPLAALVFCTAALFAVHGKAQTLPWPDAAKQNAPAAPWPSTAPGGSAPTPAAASPAPMMSTPDAAPMTPIPQAGGPRGGDGGAPCMTEFSKLQTETDKYGKAAKDASKRKVAREEMCKHLKSFAGAIGKWAKYAANNASSCGIPSKIVKQLEAGAANIAKSRDQVCADGMAGPGRAPTPTLSDALGTTVMPTTESARPSIATGTLDTLTGVPIGR